MDDNTDLEAYGVWVKKPPKNADTPLPDNTAELAAEESELIDVSLDDFLDDDIPVSAADAQPEEEQPDDDPTLDLDLTFDDDFAVQTADDDFSDIAAAADAVSAADTETNFDDIFDTIEDITAETPVSGDEKAPELQFEEVSDFDDISPDADSADETHGIETPADYNISVEDSVPSELPEPAADREYAADTAETGFPAQEPAEQTPDTAIKNNISEHDDASSADSIPDDEQEFDMEKNKEFVAKTEQMLERIVSELHTLASEFNQLRSDVEILKKTNQTAAAAPEPQDIMPDGGAPDASGFFGSDTSADGDDTIALSGDELNNILESANFVEEFGDSALDEADFSDPDLTADAGTPEPLAASENDLFVPADETDIFAGGLGDLKLSAPETGDAELQADGSGDIEVPDLDAANYDLTDENLDYLSRQPTAQETEEHSEQPDTDDAAAAKDLLDLSENSDTDEIQEEEIAIPDSAAAESEADAADTAQTAAGTAAEHESTDAAAAPLHSSSQINAIPPELRSDIKAVLSYIDQMLENLPEDKIAEFAKSPYFPLYKQLFSELGIS